MIVEKAYCTVFVAKNVMENEQEKHCCNLTSIPYAPSPAKKKGVYLDLQYDIIFLQWTLQ